MSGIKICGLFRPCDAAFINEAGPDYAGFVFVKGSRRTVTLDEAFALRTAISPSIKTVGVFAGADAGFIANIWREELISIVQLHGNEDDGFIDRLRDCLPGAEIWKAFKIRSERDLEAAASSAADQVLLDSGGGTGKCFDWSLLQSFGRPFILAGGLTPENIPEAVGRFRPYAVDLSSGVETDGVKDKSKILRAVTAARRS